MIIIIIIIIILLLLLAGLAYFFLRRKKTATLAPVQPLAAVPATAVPEAHDMEAHDTEALPVFEDEQGAYQLIEQTRHVLRKTAIEGILEGKYWGELDMLTEPGFQHCRFYNFRLYEAHIYDLRRSPTNAPLPGTPISKEKLPDRLTASLQGDDRRFNANIHEPHVEEGAIVSQMLHQHDGHEVFGTMHAVIHGYLIDFIPETYVEKRYLHQHINFPPEPAVTNAPPVPTGYNQRNGAYVRSELVSTHQRQWGAWEYRPRHHHTDWATGCAELFIGIPLVMLSFILIGVLAPYWGIVLPLICILLALRLVPAAVWEWASRLALVAIAAVIVAGVFLTSHTHAVTGKVRPHTWRQTIRPAPATADQPSADFLISHYASWQGYNGQQYAGNLSVYNSAYQAARQYKHDLTVPSSSPRAYDEVLYRLKVKDEGQLGGVYQLFDSIQLQQQLSRKAFAEMIVCFVQQIPYSLVLPDSCDPALYADHFIRDQLTRPDAQCDGNERFGINTPVEFMATLKGDCDTRALLLYTMLAHYDYDLCLLSSEHYRHAVIAINLPYSGQYFDYQQTHYVCWETTAPNFQPGVLPAEVSNPAYWRISLKSK